MADLSLEQYADSILETAKVNVEVIGKAKNNSLLKKILGFGAEAGVFCKAKNPETGEEFKDFIRVTEETYDLAQKGDKLQLTAYKSLKSRQFYLRPDEAFYN